VIYVKWEIYKNLKFLRQEKNLTVDELSKLSGVSKAKILSIERELSFEHNIEDIARLALVLDVTVDDFVFQKFYEE
jgi:transcriptional regulator with XRE-family HTH domain